VLESETPPSSSWPHWHGPAAKSGPLSESRAAGFAGSSGSKPVAAGSKDKEELIVDFVCVWYSVEETPRWEGGKLPASMITGSRWYLKPWEIEVAQLLRQIFSPLPLNRS